MPSRFSRSTVRITSCTTFGARPWRRLVEQHQAGRAEQRARDRDHLHLAAGQVLALAVHQVLERAEDLEALLLAPRAEARALARDGEVARHGERREDAPVVGHPADAGARDLVRRRARDVAAVEADRGRVRGGVRPRIERSVVVLPAPFGPSSATTSPAPTASDTSNSACVSP